MSSEQRAKLEPWQEGMPCRFRGDGLCIANCAAACRCLSPAFLWAEAAVKLKAWTGTMTDKTLDDLQRERDTARQAVIDWMDADAKKQELRLTYQTPAWAEYERAEAALKEAKASPDFLLKEVERLQKRDGS